MGESDEKDIYRETWVRYLGTSGWILTGLSLVADDPGSNLGYFYGGTTITPLVVLYKGYANEVGESFRSLVPNSLVRASYGVATVYTLADTADKSYKMYKKDGRPKSVMIETGDALIWQTLASIVIPGFIINRLCAVSRYALTHAGVGCTARNWLSVVVGLSSIPFIVHPIDEGSTMIMDETYRKWVKP